MQNFVSITGNVGYIKETPTKTGGMFTNISICWNQRKKDKTNDSWTSIPHWFTVKKFSDESLGLTKGDFVTVAGKLMVEVWTPSGNEPGQARRDTVIWAESIEKTSKEEVFKKSPKKAEQTQKKTQEELDKELKDDLDDIPF